MSQIYIFHDQAGAIPGIPGLFSQCQVEVGDDGSVNVLQLSRGQETIVIDSTVEPVVEPEPEPEPVQQEEVLPVQEPIEVTQEPQDVTPPAEPEQVNQ